MFFINKDNDVMFTDGPIRNCKIVKYKKTWCMLWRNILIGEKYTKIYFDDCIITYNERKKNRVHVTTACISFI